MWPFSSNQASSTDSDAPNEANGGAKIERAQQLWERGTRYLERRRPEKAVECFEQAHEIEPTRLEGRLNLGAALYLVKRPEEALGHLRYVLALEPQNTIALLNLAATYDALGDIKHSVETLEKLVASRPNWVDANYNLAVAYMKQERADEAALALRRELTLNPKHDAARTLLNEIHLKIPRSKAKNSAAPPASMLDVANPDAAKIANETDEPQS